MWFAQSLHPDPDLNYSISKRRVWSGLVFLCEVPRWKEGDGKGREENEEDKKIELVQREENVRRVFVCFQRKMFAESLLCVASANVVLSAGVNNFPRRSLVAAEILAICLMRPGPCIQTL